MSTPDLIALIIALAMIVIAGYVPPRGGYQ